MLLLLLLLLYEIFYTTLSFAADKGFPTHQSLSYLKFVSKSYKGSKFDW